MKNRFTGFFASLSLLAISFILTILTAELIFSQFFFDEQKQIQFYIPGTFYVGLTCISTTYESLHPYELTKIPPST